MKTNGHCDCERTETDGATGHALGCQPTDIRITQARLGLTRAQLAHALGVSEHTVTSWLNGRRQPAAATAALLERLGEGDTAERIDAAKAAHPDGRGRPRKVSA